MTPETDIIDSATPLECRYADIHPRLYITRERFEELGKLIKTGRYAAMFAEVQKQADHWVGREIEVSGGTDSRGCGCALPHLAMSAVLTGDDKYVESAQTLIRAMTCGVGNVLSGGHFLHGMGVAYDWLYDRFDEVTLNTIRETVASDAAFIFNKLSFHESSLGNGYTCNHLAVALGGLTAAACALYGDLPNVSPWARCCVDKARSMTAALGPDGASQEGITYGEYYNEFYIKTLLLIRDLLGIDFFEGNEYLQNLPLFYTYSALPRNEWSKEHSLINFGDGVRYHWYGPDSHLRPLADVYNDPRAQWLADEISAAGTPATSATFLNLVTHDPEIPVTSPRDLPTFHHFEDKDIVFMRSGWDGDESITAFKCGPHAGHFAHGRFTSEVGGGHMNPDAGTFQLFAEGERMISGDGYFIKTTEYQNVMMVNGIGQEGDNSDWFESLEFRRGKKQPSILRAESGEGIPFAIADVGPAYRDEAGLNSYVRHIYMISGSCWVVVDKIEAEKPSTFELLFHSDLPFKACGDRNWTAIGERGRLQITSLLPSEINSLIEVQPMKYVDGKVTHNYPLLRISNEEKTRKASFVTVLQSSRLAKNPWPLPELDEAAMTLPSGEFVLQLEREDPTTPVLT